MTTELITEMSEFVNKHGGENTATHLMVQAIQELRRLQAENEGLRAQVDRSDTPTGLQPDAILPAFIGTPKRKLNELLAQGFQVSGLAIERQAEGANPVRGFIDVNGLVGWWSPDTQAENLRLRAQLEAPIWTAVAEGWKLVPVEPTEAMAKAGLLGCRTDGGPAFDNLGCAGLDDAEAVYQAMLAAAPQADGHQLTVISLNDWEPCSPGWLARGGNCADAPRLWHAPTCNHWHPKIAAAPQAEAQKGGA